MSRRPIPLLSPIRLKRTWTMTQWLRLLSLTAFFLATAYGIVRHRINEAAGMRGHSNAAPNVDALCPMGGLETLWTWIQTGEPLRHLHLSDIVLLVGAVLLVLLLGGAFCGWICPFGAIQEWLYRLRARLLPWQVTIPPKVDQVLRYGRYLVLALVLGATYASGEFVFGEYCPWKAVWSVGGDELAIAGAIILGLVLAGGLLVERAWCRYACPLGGFLGLFNKIAPVRIVRAKSCTHCSLCTRKCPMGIDLEEVTAVTDTSCIRCLECVDTCPRPETLAVKLGWWQKARTLPGPFYGAIAVAIFVGVILAAMATGNWEAYSAGAAPAVSEATGLPDPVEIKGWRSLQEVSDLWGIPLGILYRETKLDPALVPPTTSLKELEDETGDRVSRATVIDLVTRWQAGKLR